MRRGFSREFPVKQPAFRIRHSRRAVDLLPILVSCTASMTDQAPELYPHGNPTFLPAPTKLYSPRPTSFHFESAAGTAHLRTFRFLRSDASHAGDRFMSEILPAHNRPADGLDRDEGAARRKADI